MTINSININPLSLNWNYKTGSCATLLVALSTIGVVAGIFALLGAYNIVSFTNLPFLGTNGSLALLGGSSCALALGIIWSFSLLHNRHKKGKKSHEDHDPDSKPSQNQHITPYNKNIVVHTNNDRNLSGSLVEDPSDSLEDLSENDQNLSDSSKVLSENDYVFYDSSKKDISPPPLQNSQKKPHIPLPIPEDLLPFLEEIKTALLNKDLSYRRTNNEYYQLLERCGVQVPIFQQKLTKREGLTSKGIENSEEWEMVKQKLAGLFAQTAMYVDQKPRLEWIHGTRSPTLIGIDRTAQESFSEGKHLLVPTGILVAHNIVPLTGELLMGIADNGANQDNLSGVRATFVEGAKRYSDESGFCFKPEEEKSLIDNFLNEDSYCSIIRLKIAVLRLLLSSKTTKKEKERIKSKLNEIIDSPEYSREVASTWKNYAHLLGTSFNVAETEKKSNLLVGEAVGVPRSRGPATWGIIIGIGEEKSDQERGFHVLLENGATKWVFFSKCKKPQPGSPLPEIAAPTETLRSMEQRINPKKSLEELRDLCDSTKPWILKDEEKKYLTDSFPILWGASKISEDRYQAIYSDVKGERGIRGSLALGEEVTSAFTKKKDLPRLTKWLKQRSLAVSPMTTSAAFFLTAYAHYQSQTA